ncbi:hypothetical protein GF323_05495 [Candidatus Woesearchaeota archaeon]|nr:hypothetical protein [Candidatus Woesearchaeota archaeon]
MNQKQIGTIVIIIGVILAVFVYLAQQREEAYIKNLVQEKGSCFLEDGTCLHERSLGLYIVGYILSAGLIILGLYLLLFDKTQKLLAEQQARVSSALEKASKKDEFNAYLSGFSKEEQDILKAVREQEGIKQSTLRFRTGISKTKLSLLLKSLEERDVVKRKTAGKTNEVYLRKKF